MQQNLILQFVLISLSFVVIVSSTCQETINSVPYRGGTISGGDKYGCKSEVYKIDFGSKRPVKLTWTSFNVGGEMPICSSGNLKVKVG